MAQKITELPAEEREKRLKFDIITYCTMSCRRSLAEVNRNFLEVNNNSIDSNSIFVTDDQRFDIFIHTWNIIDRIFQVRRIFSSDLVMKDNKSIQTYMNDTRDWDHVRNSMDHVHENLGNLVKKTRLPNEPIFGVISAGVLPLYLIEGEIEEIPFFVLSNSEFHHKIRFIPVGGELFPFHPPVDHVVMSAFTKRLKVSAAVLKLCRLTNVLALRKLQRPGNDRRFSVKMTARFQTPVKVKGHGRSLGT